MSRAGFFGVVALACAGCAATIELDPFPETTRPDAKLVGHVEAEVEPVYLPRSFVAVPPEETRAPTLRYHTQVAYEPIKVIERVDPLPVLGFRKLGMDVIVQGFLEIDRAGSEPHLFQEQCTVYMRRSTWGDVPSNTVLRDIGLRCVRDLFDDRIAAAAKKNAAAKSAP